MRRLLPQIFTTKSIQEYDKIDSWQSTALLLGWPKDLRSLIFITSACLHNHVIGVVWPLVSSNSLLSGYLMEMLRNVSKDKPPVYANSLFANQLVN